MNAEYDARNEYRMKNGLENKEWKKVYEAETDSKGNKKPSYKGNKNNE